MASVDIQWKEVVWVLLATLIVAILLSFIPNNIFVIINDTFAEEIKIFSIVFFSVVAGRQLGLVLYRVFGK